MGNIFKKLRRRFMYAAGAVSVILGLVVGPSLPAAVQTARAEAPNSKPWNITAGPDGALWFTELDANRIGRITTAGTITEYPIPTANAGPHGITAGPDNALWFTETNVSKIGRIGTDGTITEYNAPRNANNDEVKPTDIVKGSDGQLWYASTGSIGSMTTAGVGTRYDLVVPYNNLPVKGIANTISGIWFTVPNYYSHAASALGRTNYGTNMNIYPMLPGLATTDITGESNDRVWVTTTPLNGAAQASDIIWGVVEDGGYFTPYALPLGTAPSNIEQVPNSADLWYTGKNNNTVVHFTRNSPTNMTVQLAAGSCPQGLTAGPNNSVWFTEACSNKIGRVDASGNLTEYPITGIPAAPTNLSATSPATQANLSWSASAGAASYNVYRNGVLIGNTANTSYTDSPVSGNYSYYVKAVGYSGLESDASNTITVIVATAPLVTITNPANNGTVSGTVNVTGMVYSASTYSRSFYIFNSNGQTVGSQYQFAVPNSTTTMSYTWDTTQVPNGLYTLNLSARDSQGNKDANSTSVVKVTVQN